MRILGILGGIFLVAGATSASAQLIPSSEQPGRERFRFTDPEPPLTRLTDPFIVVPSSTSPENAARIRFRLQRVEVEGSTVYGKAELNALFEGLIGREITAADAYAAATAIGTKYGRDGYLVARTVVVPQRVDPRAAVIRFRVVEGYIERVEWPEAAKRYRDFFADCISQITSERPARTGTIERCLLLSSDLPGLRFTSTLRPGSGQNGSAVLVVAVTEKPIDAEARIDNRGSRGRGPWQYAGSFALNNQLGWHESLNLTYAGAFETNELQFFGGRYRQVLNADGLSLDLSGNYSFGKPGLASLKAIDFKNESSNFEGGLTYPLIRTREQNLFVSALGFAEDATGTALTKRLIDDRLRGFRLRASYDELDSLFYTIGQTQVVATYSQGIDGLGSTRNRSPFASVAAGRVDFSKVELGVSRTQTLFGAFSVVGAAFAQWGSSALLSPEQCTYGGRLFGRAFDPDQFAGDRCWSVLGELRYDLPPLLTPLIQSQLYG